MSWVGTYCQVDILLIEGIMVGYTARAYYKKLPLMDFTRFVSAELSFGAEIYWVAN